ILQRQKCASPGFEEGVFHRRLNRLGPGIGEDDAKPAPGPPRKLPRQALAVFADRTLHMNWPAAGEPSLGLGNQSRMGVPQQQRAVASDQVEDFDVAAEIVAIVKVVPRAAFEDHVQADRLKKLNEPCLEVNLGTVAVCRSSCGSRETAD